MRMATVSSPAVAAGAMPDCRPQRQHDGERARPERRCQAFGASVDDSEIVDLPKLGQVHDERVARGPAFGRIEPGDSRSVGGKRPQAVDGLRRKGRDLALAQGSRNLGDAVGRGLHAAGHRRSARQPMSLRWKPSGQSIRATAA